MMQTQKQLIVFPLTQLATGLEHHESTNNQGDDNQHVEKSKKLSHSWYLENSSPEIQYR